MFQWFNDDITHAGIQMEPDKQTPRHAAFDRITKTTIRRAIQISHRFADDKYEAITQIQLCGLLQQIQH